jgi:hypothetical protein
MIVHEVGCDQPKSGRQKADQQLKRAVTKLSCAMKQVDSAISGQLQL